MANRLQIVIVSEDPTALAKFWQDALGYVEETPPDGYETWDEFADAVGIPEDERNDIASAIDADEVGPRLLFERWDAGGPQKRVHLDINVMARQFSGTGKERKERLPAEVRRLEAAGATFVRQVASERGEIWVELTDPEGNWFCVQ